MRQSPAETPVPEGGLSLESLAQLVRQTDPAALLVSSRIVRRVIKEDRRLTVLGLSVPHRKCYVVPGETLLQLADRDELGLGPAEQLPPLVLLLAAPDPARLMETPPEQVLYKYSRLLFHARIDAHFTLESAAGRLDSVAVRRRVERIGAVEFDEIRVVLKQENFLLPPLGDERTYAEFAAVYLELKHFADALLPQFFPGITDHRRIDELLAADVDAERLLAATRLPGAPETWPSVTPSEQGEEAPAADASQPGRGRLATSRWYDWLRRRADRAAGVGNHVRAAILRTRAGLLATESAASRSHQAARVELKRLAERLQAALELDDNLTHELWEALLPLLPRSARGFWTRESRILYDLQKVCVDHEREIYTLDLVQWLLSGFALPIKRPLPGQREVLMTKHLLSAIRRLTGTRLSESQRSRLGQLLRDAAEQAEAHLRRYFRPLVSESLVQVGLAPQSLPERVALRTLVEELLDRIVERGFLTMLDLRDAVSRNGLKLPDLESLRHFFRGDRLLQADNKLARALDGVYHKGEIYLRWPQRISALAFGTRTGRWFIRFVALPFGGAYLVLAFLMHLLGPLRAALGGVSSVPATAAIEASAASGLPAAPAASPHPPVLSVILLGLFLLNLLHLESFRRGCLEALKLFVRFLRTTCVDWPRRVLQWPAVRAILDSRAFLLFRRYVFKPLLLTLLICAVLPGALQDTLTAVQSVLIIFLAVNLAINSRVGRTLEEVTTDWVVRNWERFRIRVLAALLRVIMEFFHRVLDTIDRVLYTVDEVLRFRSGQGRVSATCKAILGVFWFFVVYVVRFFLNLLVEPQINPVKHFPIVTVSHKILLPLQPYVSELLDEVLGKVSAQFYAAAIVLLLPGVVGFLVWELKENWRLYAANRPRALGPVIVGSHGETLVRLLRLGFHSGTAPKLYARLRRAERKAWRSGNWNPALRQRERLAHLAQDVRHFCERGLLFYLEECAAWERQPVLVGRVEVSVNRLHCELCREPLDDEGVWISFAEQSGWLLAGINQPGWLRTLSPDKLQIMQAALAGLYKFAGVDMVHEQLRSVLGPRVADYDVNPGRLEVRGAPPHGESAYYDLDRGWQLVPRPLGAETWPARLDRLPTLARDQLFFSARPISWRRWLELWELREAGRTDPAPLVEGQRLLPE